MAEPCDPNGPRRKASPGDAMTTWINVKTAAALGSVSPRTFREEWVPEDGLAQVRFRNPNGKVGRGRRPEVDLEDLEAVLADREIPRTRF